MSSTTHQRHPSSGMNQPGIKCSQKRKGRLEQKAKLALEVQSGTGGQSQGKGPTCRDESPRPEAESTEERMWRARKRVRAFQNLQKELMAICHFSFEVFKTKNVSSDTCLEHRVVSCGWSAPLQSITTARGAGSALGLLADPSTRQLSSSCIHSTSCLSSQHLISRPHSSGCGHVYSSP